MCAPVFFANASGNTLEITPTPGSSGTLAVFTPTTSGLPNPPYLPNQVATFVVVGTFATFTYGTDAGGFINSVLNDVITAFNTDPVMSLLGTASAVGAGTLPDGQKHSWVCVAATNIVLGLKGMKVYPLPA